METTQLKTTMIRELHILSKKIELGQIHPDLLLKIKRMLNYSNRNLLIHLPNEILIYILKFAFQDWKTLWTRRDCIMAFSTKKNFNFCYTELCKHQIHNPTFFSSSKTMYRELQAFQNMLKMFSLAPRMELVIFAKFANVDTYEHSTQSKKLGVYIGLVDCLHKNTLKEKAMELCTKEFPSALTAHVAKMVVHCGGKNAVSPFTDFDVLNINIGRDIPIWFIDCMIHSQKTF